MEAEAENETSPCIPLLSSVYFCLEWGVDMQSGRKVEHVMKWHKNWLPPNIIYILTLTKTSFDSLILFEANYILNYLIESSINNIMPLPLSFHQTKFFSLTPWNFKQDREAVGSLFAVFTVRYRHIVRGWLLIPRSVWLDRFHSLAPQAVQLSISTDVSYIQCVENSILKINYCVLE